MLTFTVDFSVNRHKIIINVVILLRANILADSCQPLCDKHVIAMCPRAIKD